MPLFQYLCGHCETETELLVRGEERPACPKCGSDKLIKQASRFNAMNGGTKPQPKPAPCGMPQGCCGGVCGLN